MRSARASLLVLTLLASLALSLMAPSSAQAATKKPARLSVLTFNVCSQGKACRDYPEREDAIVRRILSTDADVVNLQETQGVANKLNKRLRKRGYFMAGSTGPETIFAKSSTLTPVTRTSTVTGCHVVEQIYATPATDTSDWDTSRPHQDENGTIWYYDHNGRWYYFEEECVTEKVTVPRYGGFSLNRDGRTAVWAMLRVKKTNKWYLFVNAHLTSGKNENAKKRSRETATLLRKSAKIADGRPRVFAGDFNSSIKRGKDTVGQRMKAKGFADAYTKARSRKNAKYHSATGTGKRPKRGGSHIDRVFVPRGASVKSWALDVRTRKGRTARPVPSDHSPVRVVIRLP